MEYITEEKYQAYKRSREQQEKREEESRRKMHIESHTCKICKKYDENKKMWHCRSCPNYFCKDCGEEHDVEFSGDRFEFWYYCNICLEKKRKREEERRKEEHMKQTFEARYKQEKFWK
jgi:hypothetical protein